METIKLYITKLSEAIKNLFIKIKPLLTLENYKMLSKFLKKTPK